MKTKRIKSFTIALGSLLFLSIANAFAMDGNKTEQFGANELLAKVLRKLESAGTLQYNYLLEINYFSENYSSGVTGTAYLDFSANVPVIGFRYQLEDENSKFVYNGTESFFLDKGRKTMRVTPKPSLNDFTGLTPVYNSLVTLRKALPSVIVDNDIQKSISDTSYAKQDFHLVKLVLDKRTIERLGGFSELTTKRKITYDIIIDKSSLMPVQIIQGNSVNNDFVRSVFSNVSTNAVPPSELSWFYSSYTADFAVSHKKTLEPLAKNTLAPDWQLPMLANNEAMRLSQLKGKVVLLEFWTKNCGHCILAVPKLNALADRFKRKDFAVLGVNLYDSQQDVESFYQKNRPNYKTVLEGGKVAEEYGIGSYPMVVLLDKQGKVLYTGGLDEQEIVKYVQQALK
jgi:thiol-disulfide isomerase/thioredoxin